jgi:hypothetical protein
MFAISCLILHNVAVMERVTLDNVTHQNNIYYDVVNNDAGNKDIVNGIPASEAEVLQFLQMIEEDVNE